MAVVDIGIWVVAQGGISKGAHVKRLEANGDPVITVILLSKITGL